MKEAFDAFKDEPTNFPLTSSQMSLGSTDIVGLGVLRWDPLDPASRDWGGSARVVVAHGMPSNMSKYMSHFAYHVQNAVPAQPCVGKY